MTNLKSNLTTLQQKAKERTVKTQNIEYDLDTLVRKIKNKVIKLDPEYQRRHRWDYATSSRLIESLILNIPIPQIYLSQDVDVDEEVSDEITRYSVIDGQQRLTAILTFLNNDFPLEGLEALPELIDSYYRDLPPFLIRRLEERTIKCLRIDSTVDSQVKYDIFERLNSGSVKLQAQELRNAVHRGYFNSTLKELAKDINFRTLLHVNVNDPDNNRRVQKMEDVELVLRFFSLIDGGYMRLKKGFKQFLDDEMESMSKLDDSHVDKLAERFTRAMKIIRDHFGDSAFAKYRAHLGEKELMSNFNAAVFDALSVAVITVIDKDKMKITKHSVLKFENLFADSEFFSAVEGSVNDKAKIVTRIELAVEALRVK